MISRVAERIRGAGLWAAPALVVAALTLGCGEEVKRAATPSQTALPPAKQTSDFFGINGHTLRFKLREEGSADLIETSFRHLEGGGIGFVRAEADWRQLQPSAPGEDQAGYDFSELDTWVGLLAEHGMRWQPMLGLFVPEWAASAEGAEGGCGSRSAPSPDVFDDYADTMAALAERYGRGGGFWAERTDLEARPITSYEVWNEPNLSGNWCPFPDPTAYADLYSATHAAVHTVDPQALVVTGGLAAFRVSEPANGKPIRQDFVNFLKQMFAAFPPGQEVDAVGAHSYGPPAEMLANLATYRATLDSLGRSAVPIDFNEFGWAVVGPKARAEEERVAFIGEMAQALAASNCKLSGVAPYSWVTLGEDRDDPQDFFGLADPETGASLESGLRYLELARKLPPEPRAGAGPCA